MDEQKQQLKYTRTGWTYTTETGFMIVVNDTNEDERKNSIVLNPIDTLPRKNKFSGNYVQDNKNFITVRDGKTPSSYLFFIHFEKNDGKCVGELKGELKMKDENNAYFSANGDPCVIDFKFSGSEIKVKEQGNCGNHRDIKCFFNDTYEKKRDPKPAKKK